MTFSEDLGWRGCINQLTHPELGKLLDTQCFTLYCGFDPTADSLHIGSLLPILTLRRFQLAGHTPIALVGGATGMIGDPSGKTQERQLQTAEQVEHNVAGIRKQLERFIDFSGAQAATLVNNADWLGQLNLISFLRDIGKHFSVNMMMSKDSVRQRLEDRDHGISYTEFTYMLLQAYDFLHLNETQGCTLQVGGSDQWGNIVAGMDLIRRTRGTDAYGLTIPLVTKADGSKFGKTESGNVWLDAHRTSPYKFYQFWINQADADVPRYLRFFTFLSREEIENLERQIAEAPEKRAAQLRLAEELTRLVHGDDALQNAIKASQAMFGGELAGLDEATLEDIFSDMPSSNLPRTALSEERLLAEVLTEAGVFASKGEARRMIKSGGVYLNNRRIEADDATLNSESLVTEHIAVVRKGKKNYHLLRFA